MPEPSSRAGVALAFGAGGFFLVYFGQVVLGVVQPEIQSDLDLDNDRALWVLNAFMLGLAALVSVGGRLADVIGPRATILAGLWAMALGATGAAVAPGFGTLVAALAVQGAGAGLAIAATIAIVVAAFPAERRGRAVGSYGGIGVLALPLAPLAAGALVEVGEWRLTFWLTLALTLGVLAIGHRGLSSEPGRGERLDITGSVVSIAGIALLLGGAVQAAAWGWTSPATLAVLGAGVALLILFVAMQLRTAQPLLDIELLRNLRLASAAVALFLVQLGTNGFAIYIPVYLLTLVGLDPLVMGVAMLAAMAFPPILSPIAGVLADRLGTRPVAVGGTVLAAAGLAWSAAFVPDEEYAILVPGFALFGIGVPMAFVGLLTAGAQVAPPSERGAAAGVMNSARWIGATVGTVAFGAVLSAVRESRLDDALAGRSLSGRQTDQLDRLVLADEDATRATAGDLGQDVVDAVADSFAGGYRWGLWLCCAMLALAALVTALGPHSARRPDQHDPLHPRRVRSRIAQ
jgi:EmrB/QacA subfamily drug resistance transporter